MALHASIFAKLSDSLGATAALVGSGNSCRVYPEQAPAATRLPYAVVSHVSTAPATTHGETYGTAHRLVQVSCFAATMAEALALRSAIISDLDNVTLADGDAAMLQDERSTYESAVDVFRADADFLV
jgi:hypothetical protein